MVWFEDFEEGLVFEYTVPGLTVDEIVSFAEQYDPQRFHLEEAEAAKTHFGGLIASGFQTQLLCFKPFCEMVMRKAMGVGAPGIDTLKWLRPWYPGEALDVTATIVSKRRSTSRNDRGYIGIKLSALSNGMPTLAMSWVAIVLTREGTKNKHGNS